MRDRLWWVGNPAEWLFLMAVAALAHIGFSAFMDMALGR